MKKLTKVKRKKNAQYRKRDSSQLNYKDQLNNSLEDINIMLTKITKSY